MNDSHPLRGTDPISLCGWYNDLTYAEVHAAIWGVGLIATGLYPLYVALVAYAFGFNVLQYIDAIDTEEIPNQTLRQIRRQVHYFIVGGAFGGLIQWLGYGLSIGAVLPF